MRTRSSGRGALKVMRVPGEAVGVFGGICLVRGEAEQSAEFAFQQLSPVMLCHHHGLGWGARPSFWLARLISAPLNTAMRMSQSFGRSIGLVRGEAVSVERFTFLAPRIGFLDFNGLRIAIF